MTREEAIEAIKCNWPDSRYTILREALDMAISALREQDAADKDVGNNEPLTLDELRKMDETVWVCYPQPTFGTNLLSEHMDCTRYKFSFADYGKTWLAYRQKPEEGTV